MHLLEVRVARYAAFAIALVFVSGLVLARSSPPPGRIVVTETETEILDVIEFEPGTAMLRPRSFATLDAVAATLHGNPSIELVEVQARTATTQPIDPVAGSWKNERIAFMILRRTSDTE